MKSHTKSSLLLIAVFILISFLLYHNSKIYQKLFSTYCVKNSQAHFEEYPKQATNQPIESSNIQNINEQFSVLDCISCLNLEEISLSLQTGNIQIDQSLQTKSFNGQISIKSILFQQTECYEYECPDFHILNDFKFKSMESKAKLLKYGFINNLHNLNMIQIKCHQNNDRNICWRNQQILSNQNISSFMLRHRIAYNNNEKSLIQQIPSVVFKYTVYNMLNRLIIAIMWFMILMSTNYKKITKNMNEQEIKVFIGGISILVVLILIPTFQKYASAIFLGFCIHFLPLIFYDIKCPGWVLSVVSIICIVLTTTTIFQLLQKGLNFFFIVILLLYGGFSRLYLLDKIIIWFMALELFASLIIISIYPELDNHVLSLVPIYILFCGISAQNCQLKNKQKHSQSQKLSAHQLQTRIQRQLSNNQTQMII